MFPDKLIVASVVIAVVWVPAILMFIFSQARRPDDVAKRWNSLEWIGTGLILAIITVILFLTAYYPWIPFVLAIFLLLR